MLEIKEIAHYSQWKDIRFYIRDHKWRGKMRKKVKVVGIDFGPMFIHTDLGDGFFIWHNPGHKYWSGMHENYTESMYYLVEVTPVEDGLDKAIMHYETTPGKDWRDVVIAFDVTKSKIMKERGDYE